MLALLPAAPARAGVVINEVFYHAPDDLDDLQWIELHNPADERVDLSGWAFDKGIGYTFPPGAALEARGYLVLARNLERFREFYDDVAATGPFERSLGNSGDRIVLLDARGQRVDEVRYRDRAPWPASADGASASLEPMIGCRPNRILHSPGSRPSSAMRPLMSAK